MAGNRSVRVVEIDDRPLGGGFLDEGDDLLMGGMDTVGFEGVGGVEAGVEPDIEGGGGPAEVGTGFEGTDFGDLGGKGAEAANQLGGVCGGVPATGLGEHVEENEMRDHGHQVGNKSVFSQGFRVR